MKDFTKISVYTLISIAKELLDNKKENTELYKEVKALINNCK